MIWDDPSKPFFGSSYVTPPATPAKEAPMTMTDTARIHLPEAVDALRRSDARALVRGIGNAVEALRNFAAPTMGTRYNLFPGDSVSDYEDGEAPLSLVCPWCNVDVTTDALFDLETGMRFSYAAEIDTTEDGGFIAINWDGDRDFHSVTLMHEPCMLPVATPEGWEVEG